MKKRREMRGKRFILGIDLFWVLCVNFVAGFVAGFDL